MNLLKALDSILDNDVMAVVQDNAHSPIAVSVLRSEVYEGLLDGSLEIDEWFRGPYAVTSKGIVRVGADDYLTSEVIYQLINETTSGDR